jgi:hypothetical protein
MSQVLPTFHDARQLRAASKRAVLGMIALQPTLPVVRARRRSNLAFAGGLACLVMLYGSWIAWVAVAARVGGA